MEKYIKGKKKSDVQQINQLDKMQKKWSMEYPKDKTLRKKGAWKHINTKLDTKLKSRSHLV